VTSPATAAPPSWDLDVTDRQQRLAATLGSLVAQASVRPGSEGATALAAAMLRCATTPPGASSHGDIQALFAEIDAVRAAVGQRLLAVPLRTARRINEALAAVRDGTSVAQILRTAPAQLCSAAGFDRALISRVDGSAWLPVHWHAAGDGAANSEFGEFMLDARIVLANGMIETEVVRRRAPALVADVRDEPRTFPPLREMALSRGYVVAPIMVNGAVFGLLHADTHACGRALVESDRANLRTFADGIGVILERLALLETLTSQRERIARAFATAGSMVDDLCAAPVLLTRSDVAAVQPQARHDARADDGLTARERDVITLVASGATNAQIADQLTVSETTVKSHVKHILRKLRAANRAEAIALYLGLAAGRGRAP
jgi:DNA-binding CsgD family transcriptional regulator